VRGTVNGIGLLLAAAALVVSCASPPTPEPSSPAEPSPTPAASPVSTATATASGRCGSSDMSVDRGPYVIAGMQVPGYGFPDMGGQKIDVALRTTVVVGGVTAREAAFFAEPAHVYTPFTVQVDRVIRGDARVGKIRIAVEGGTVGCYVLRVDVAPVLQVGSRYVFFLTAPVGTEPIPTVWDVWIVNDQDVVSTVERPMPLSELVDRIDRLAAAGSSLSP
jgi:hypothetical protein